MKDTDKAFIKLLIKQGQKGCTPTAEEELHTGGEQREIDLTQN